MEFYDKLVERFQDQILCHNSSVSRKITLLYFCSSNNIYFGHKEPIKKNLDFSSARVKFCEVPYAKFETTSRFLSKFCIPLQFHERLLLCTFFSSNNIYFAHKESIKVKIFETFELSCQHLSNSLCQF